jgi:O-antigen/teichoic acid export membrane protein
MGAGDPVDEPGGVGRNRAVSRISTRLGSHRSFVTDFGWRGVDDSVGAVCALISFTLLGRSLGPEGYGAFVGIYGVLGPAATFAYSGAALAVLRSLVREGEDRTEVTRSYVALAVVQGAGFALLGSAVLTFVVPTLALWAVALLAYTELVVTGSLRILASVVQGTAGHAPATRVRLTNNLVRVATLVGLWLFDSLTLENLAIGWAVALTCNVVVAFRRQLPRLGVRSWWGRPSWSRVVQSLEFSLPGFADSMKGDSDKAILNAAGHVAGAGIYGAAYRVMKLAMLPNIAMAAVVFQRVLVNDEDEPGQHVRRAWRYTKVSVALALVVSLGLVVAAPLLVVVVGEEFRESVEVLRWLALFPVLDAVASPAINGLVGLGRARLRAGVLIAASALSVILYLMLIPPFGWQGAAAATLVSEAVLAVLAWAALVWGQARADRRPVEAQRSIAASDANP